MTILNGSSGCQFSVVISFLLACQILQLVQAQFPTVCMENATLPMAVCCPTPEGFSTPCGGFTRGACSPLNIQNETTTSRWAKLSIGLQQDDRLHWPSRFFSYACKCHGNFAGVACEKCRFGYTGPNCELRSAKRIRRNVLTMSVKEQHQLRDILHAAKSTPSNWSVVSVTGPEGTDPITRDHLQYRNVTVYDYLVYYHYYAARTTMFDDLVSCSLLDHTLDFAHKGPGFLPWHRHFMLMFEEELAHVASTKFGLESFSLPYWDWTNQTDCHICTNHLVGEFYHPSIDPTPPRSATVIQQLRDSDDTTISPQSPFSQWEVMCQYNSSYTEPCFYCDINSTKVQYVTRSFNERPGFDMFSSQEDMNFVMSTARYDTSPFDVNAPNNSFRNNLEGFTYIYGRPPLMNTHSMGHSFFKGVIRDRASSPNDPFFIFHHTFVDKVFEVWLQANSDRKQMYPNELDIPFGHQANDALVPSFPPARVSEYFVEASEFGYGYDDSRVGLVSFEPGSQQENEVNSQSSNQSNILTLLIVVTAAILAAVTAVIIYIVVHRRRKRLSHYVSLADPTSSGSPDKRSSFASFSAKRSAQQEAAPLLE